jgi:hypothetical protein
LTVLYACNVTRILWRVAGLEEVLRAAAGAGPELDELWRDNSETQRRVGATTIIDAVLAKSPLKAEIDRETAIDLLWTLNAAETYRRLVDTCGWPPERYQRWLAELYCEQLLGTPACR